MKTEAKGGTQPTPDSLPPRDPRGGASAPSFPEVLGARGARANADGEATTGAGAGASSSASSDASADADPTGAFVPLVSALAIQAVVATQTLGGKRGVVDPSSPVRSSRADPLDAAAPLPALLAPPFIAGSAGPPAAPHPEAAAFARAQASLEDVLPAIVKRIAWSGDGRKGSLRLELGAGALAGGTLIVHADEGRVKVELQAPSGTDTAAWRDRIAARLEERQIAVDEIVVA
jgi:hypothetical protein